MLQLLFCKPLKPLLPVPNPYSTLVLLGIYTYSLNSVLSLSIANLAYFPLTENNFATVAKREDEIRIRVFLSLAFLKGNYLTTQTVQF
jgi:hypothetical protein